MPNLMRSLFVSISFFSLVSAAWTADRSELVVPMVVHGGVGIVDPSELVAKQLPNGDHFLLPEQNRLLVTATQAAGLQVFGTSSKNAEEFSSPLKYESISSPPPRVRGGADEQGSPHRASVNLEGFTLSQPGSQATAESCSDHFWDVNLRVATTCQGRAPEAEKIRLFLKDSAGNEVPGGQLMELTLGGISPTDQSSGLVLTSRNQDVSVYAGDLRARAEAEKFYGHLIEFIPLSTPKGRVSPYITLSFKMKWMKSCYRVVAEVTRGNEPGCATSLILDDLVVTRQGELRQDQPGLIEGLVSAYPVGRTLDGDECPRSCAADGSYTSCKTVKFHDTTYYQLFLPQYDDSVIYAGSASGENGLEKVIVKKDAQKIRSFYLKPNPYSAFHQLNRQYITSELSIVDNAQGSLTNVSSIAIYQCSLRKYQCLGALPSTEIPAFYLSNRVSISSDITVGALIDQVKDAFKRSQDNLRDPGQPGFAERQEGIERDMKNLTRVLEELNKTASAASSCLPIQPLL